MNQRYTHKQKDDVIKRYLSGEQVMSIHKRTGISRSTIYGWINEHNYNHNVKDYTINLKDYNDIARKYERSQTMIKILQTAPCLASDSIDDRYYSKFSSTT